MRFLTYLLTDQNGNRVNYMTSEKTLKELADKYESVVMYLEKRGFTQVKEGTTTTPTATATTPTTKEIYCSDCGNKMELKTGTSKAGKSWKGYFCPKDKDHAVQWVK